MYKSIPAPNHRELSHAKTIFASINGRVVWSYIGSHNCTESAWGSHTWVGSKGNKVGKIDVRNFELGIVFEGEARVKKLYAEPLATYGVNDRPWSVY